MAHDPLPYSVDETIDSTRLGGLVDRGAPARHKARLACAYPPDIAIAVDLGRERTVLGRLPDTEATPPINHPTVSRTHFEIEWDEGLQIHLGRDMGSRNGSAVDGERATGAWHPIVPGSVVRLGDVLLAYEENHTFTQMDAPEVSRRNVPGEAMKIRALRARIARAAPDVSPVLIIGETGTGKEKIAEEVHRVSGRTGAFIAVNCATLGEQLIESQLFGHLKGAFTGAAADSPGLFRAAEGGTIFLDEIGEMPLELQPKLLRAIQEREVRAVGSTKSERIDVRVVAATHQDLAKHAHEGTFRQDLYARLAMWELAVPAVRERRADILRWFDDLYGLWAAERDRDVRPPRVHAEAAELLVRQRWPENLRGLNRLVHEVASRRLESVRVEHLPEWVRS